MSYLLHDPDGAPWIVFTGDALFAGDVGRVDLLGGDRMEELARDLYVSLFERLLPLGDEVIVCPFLLHPRPSSVSMTRLPGGLTKRCVNSASRFLTMWT